MELCVFGARACIPKNYYIRYPSLLRERKKWSYAFFGARACIPKIITTAILHSYANEKNGATRFSELAQATRCRPLNYYHRYPTLLRERKEWSYALFGASASDSL